jgi:hypothetical protein
VNAKERLVYRLELKLIRQYFKGLRPRPIRLAKKLDLGADGEAGEPYLMIKDRKRSRQELAALLEHELIHYELKDKGKLFHGHGKPFLKRAQALGIVNSYVLERCFSSEEFEHTPTIRKTKKVSLGRFTRQVNQWFSRLISEAIKLPEPYGSRLYPHVQNTYVGWLAYSSAVKEKSDHVIQEIWRLKPGRLGRDLHGLQEEYGRLQAQREELVKQRRPKASAKTDAEITRQLKAIDAAISRLRKEAERDYGISLGQ